MMRTLPLFDGFIETPFERRFQALLRQAWLHRSWHVIVAEPGSGKTMGIGDLRDEAARQAGMVGGRRYPVLAVTAPKNDPREAALGNLLLLALGVGSRGRWSERKYLLYDLLGQYGVECLICDDAHDLSMPHLIFLKELTDHLFLAFPTHPLGLCLVTAGRGASIPLKDVFDQPETMWMQFRRRLDCSQPYCRVVSHTEGEIRDILLALEQIYRPSFPELNLQQWTGSLYKWLTHPLLDPQKSGRVLMDPLMKLVTTALKWSYAERQVDVASKHLKAAAELLTLRRDTIQIIDAENNRFKEGEPEKQEAGEEQEKPKGKKGRASKKQSSSDEPENPSPK
jgi:AAA domain